MALGEIHNTFNNMIIIFISGMFYYLYRNTFLFGYFLLFGTWFLIGTYYLSPDLDLINTKSYNNWGKLKHIWIHYVDFMIHRGVSLFNPRKWSHTPILGTFSRIAYIVTPIILLLLSIIFIKNIYKYHNADYNFIWKKSVYVYSVIFNLTKVFCYKFNKEIIISFIGIESSSLCHIILDFYGKNKN